MTVWRLPDRTPLSGSHWKPVNAGDMNMRCDFESPAPGGSTVIAADGRLRIKAELQAGYDHRDNGSWISYWGQGITEIRVAVLRGTEVWKEGVGWMSLDVTTTNSFASINVDELRFIQDSAGNTTLVLDQTVPVDEIGAGSLRVQVYMESHPRKVPPGRRIGYNPRLAGLFTQSLRIDGTPPDTRILSVTPSGARPFVVGRASDNTGIKQVLLTLHDRYTGLFWSDRESTWSTRDEQIPINVHAQGGWLWSFPEAANPGSGVYEVTATAEDIADRPQTRDNRLDRNQLDPTPATAIIARTSANPVVEITEPAEDMILATGDDIAGTALDDGAIDTLTLSIKDRFNGQWWNPITSDWDAAPSKMTQPQLILAGEAHSVSRDEWAYEWRANFIEPTSGSGHYELNLIATDLAGNTGVATLDVLGSIDRVNPSITISNPSANEVIEAYADVGSLLSIIGFVEDDRATPISSVQLAVEDTQTGLWWNFQGQSWQGGRIDQGVTWYEPRVGETITDFIDSRFQPFTSADPGSGSYRLFAHSIDGAGNQGAEVTRDFSIVLVE